MTGYDRRADVPLPADLLARLSLALRAALTGERDEASLLPLTREFVREARRRGIPPEGAVLAFKNALGAPPPRAYEGRYHRIRDQLVTQCIAAYYAPAMDTPPRVPVLEGERRFRAVIVDDDPVMAALVRYILEPVFHVETFDDAHRALASCYERRPDLVVLDMHLPDYSGRTLLAVLRGDARLRGVPAIAITGDDSDALERQLLADGFGAYFRKPLLDSDEIRRVATALAEAGTRGAAAGLVP